MSNEYKQYIDKLCKDADNGSIQAAKELLGEADKWSVKSKEVIDKRDKK